MDAKVWQKIKDLGPNAAQKCAARKSMLTQVANIIPPVADIILQYGLSFVRWSPKAASGRDVIYPLNIEDPTSTLACLVLDHQFRPTFTTKHFELSATERCGETTPEWNIHITRPADTQNLLMWEVGLANDKINKSWVTIQRKDLSTGRYEIGKNGGIILWRDFVWPKDAQDKCCHSVLQWRIDAGNRASVMINASELIEFAPIVGLEQFRLFSSLNNHTAVGHPRPVIVIRIC